VYIFVFFEFLFARGRHAALNESVWVMVVGWQGLELLHVGAFVPASTIIFFHEILFLELITVTPDTMIFVWWAFLNS